MSDKRLSDIEIRVLKCSCGCGDIAISVNGTRVTDSSSGGPWKVLHEKTVRRDWLLEAIGVTGHD